jgi:phosphopantetheine adenylyltransferase
VSEYKPIVFEDISHFLIQIPDYKSNSSTIPENTYNIFYFDSITTNIPFYNKIALGGSFDHLHNGHRKLLTYASTYCVNTLVIGIMADSMLHKKTHADLISSYRCRKESVMEFITMVSNRYCTFLETCVNEHKQIYLENNIISTQSHTLLPIDNLTVDIHELYDPFGPAVSDPNIEALAVSSETIKGKITTKKEMFCMCCEFILYYMG